MATIESEYYDERDLTINDITSAIKRRVFIASLVAILIFALGAILAATLPTIFRSEAVILIEQQEIPADLVRSTVTSFAEQRIQVMSQRVLSSSNLMEYVEKFDLYREDRERLAREDVVDKMRENIFLEMISADVVDPDSGRPTEATIAFSLAFEHQQPQDAQRVTNEIVTAFLNENIKERTSSSTETTEFLNKEAESLGARVKELEKAIAKFKDENVNARPELEGLTREMMNRTELNLAEIERRLHETMQHKIYLEGQLTQYKPYLPDASLPRGMSAIEQLKSVETQLSYAEASYGEQHPDVIRLRKQAAAMRETVDPTAARELYQRELLAARSEAAELQKRYGADHPDVNRAQKHAANIEEKLSLLPEKRDEAPNNPTYVALAARLQAANAELASMELKRAELTRKMDEHLQVLIQIPDAEAEYRALVRDYETALGKYREISAKQMEAKLSQNLESERKGEKFTLIEPPLLPERPVRPNRLAIVLGSLFLSLIGAGLTVYFAELLDDKLRTRRDIQTAFGAPPLANIPNIDGLNEPSHRKTLFLLLSFCLAIGLVALAVVHFLFMPLDVFWFAVLRKLGV